MESEIIRYYFFWSSIIFLSQSRQHCMMILLSWLNDLSKRKRFCSKGRKIWVNIVHAYTHRRTHSFDVSVHCIIKVMICHLAVSSQNEWVTRDTHVFPLDQVKSTNMVSHLKMPKSKDDSRLSLQKSIYILEDHCTNTHTYMMYV